MKHFVKCIAGKDPEDGVAVRMQEESLGRFEESWLTANAGNSSKSGSGNNSWSRSSKRILSAIFFRIFILSGDTNNIKNKDKCEV